MQQQLEDSINSITRLFYQRGYRQHFTLSAPGSGRPMQSGDLTRCLRYFFQSKGTAPGSILELQTHAPYRSDIICRFVLNYDAKIGFKVKEMHVSERNTQAKHHFHFSNNNQLPGALSVEGFFPKLKPWQKHLRGRGFRK